MIECPNVTKVLPLTSYNVPVHLFKIKSKLPPEPQKHALTVVISQIKKV